MTFCNLSMLSQSRRLFNSDPEEALSDDDDDDDDEGAHSYLTAQGMCMRISKCVFFLSLSLPSLLSH